MFTRKKSLYKRKSFYFGIVAAVGAVFLLLTFISAPNEPEAENIHTEARQSVDQKVIDSNRSSKNDDLSTNDFENNDSETNNNVQENQSGEYYLIKESEGKIKVYRYDNQGDESLIRTTDILFSLLGSEDQELFSEGVIVNTKEELLELLQDFES